MPAMSLERDFNPRFTTKLALREKQIQQSYRPIIGVHKWFARRPGTVFRALLLSEFNATEPLELSYWRTHRFKGVIADPFMGGGTPIFEANRLGFHTIGADINPMAHWIVRQSLEPLDLDAFRKAADKVIADVQKEIGEFYTTRCHTCQRIAPVKYFMWVKTANCPTCQTENDLFPGYLLAEAERHPRHVLACAQCGHLNEYEEVPTREHPGKCERCSSGVYIEGPVARGKVTCRQCATAFSYVRKEVSEPPAHRMWALEYHCPHCKPHHTGRFFKAPDEHDLAKYTKAARRFRREKAPLVPADEIPAGDETNRLHRWGYRRYREMFNERQLLGLSLLLKRIKSVRRAELRHALLTVFSDTLRYQNMLCRYDTYALKCQDIFSVHGFPVGLIQCENNVLGIPRVGSGAFSHFVEKYLRAKEYCKHPFETMQTGSRKQVIPIVGERIRAVLTDRAPHGPEPEAWLSASSATEVPLRRGSLDGVFTDPPYFDNVQYAELMDFCFAWLKLGLAREFEGFRRHSTRSGEELTGNETLGRGMKHFTEGLSRVFRHYARAMKPQAPFVFTYHHNDPGAYLPLVVAILDAGLNCTATLPVAAEMSASLHISGTGSSVLDSVFVCRLSPAMDTSIPLSSLSGLLEAQLRKDAAAMFTAGVRITQGDLRCLLAGHIARLAVNTLRPGWNADASLADRMAEASRTLEQITAQADIRALVEVARKNANPQMDLMDEEDVTPLRA
jgi:adenine-specific DNA methylase